MENVSLNKTSLNWMFDAARWARFIAILGFILIGFLVIVGIFIGPVLSALNESMAMGSSTSTLSGGLFAAIYLAIAFLYFFPVYYLFQFSNGLIKAFKAEDEEKLNASLHFLKKHFKFIGILTIVVLAIYILLFVAAIFVSIAGLL